jgi:hypothetical protein
MIWRFEIAWGSLGPNQTDRANLRFSPGGDGSLPVLKTVLS